MKKTIASMTLLVAAVSVHARGPGPINPRPAPVPKTYCLSIYENQDGSTVLGTCDRSDINKRMGLPLNENECAEGQAAFTSVDVKIRACPTFVQL